MTRQPIQVLVIPFRRSKSGIEYCVLRRSDGNYWQFVAGGVESGETLEEAARREAQEEIGAPLDSEIIKLDSMCCVPANIFSDWKKWPKGTYVVREFSFGLNLLNESIDLSSEHSEYEWKSFEDALQLLHWDSNKTALWELSQRLQKT